MSLKKDFHGVLVEQTLLKKQKKASFEGSGAIALFLPDFNEEFFLVEKDKFLKNEISKNWLNQGEKLDFLLKQIFLESDEPVLLVPLDSPNQVLKSPAVFGGFSPNIFLSPAELKVEKIQELLLIAEKMRAIVLTDIFFEEKDLFSKDSLIEKSMTYPQDKRLGLFFPQVKGIGFEEFLPLSFFAGKSLLKQKVFDSLSGTMIRGIEKLKNPIPEDEIRGDLNPSQISSVFNHGGVFRFCGFYSRFPKQEGLLYQLQVQRTADAIEKSFKNFFYTKIDKGITNTFLDNLYVETENFLINLVSKGVINDFTLEIDKDISKLVEGNLGYKIEIAPTPSLEKVVIKQVLSEPLLAKYFDGGQ